MKYRSLSTKIEQLKKITAELEKLQKKINKKEFLSSHMARWAIERGLQLSLEATLDIASHIIGEMEFGKAENYKENFEILAREKILPVSFAKKFKGAAGFRNILVHDYVDVDPKKVYEHFKNDSKDIKKFVNYVSKWLKKGDLL